MTPLKTKARALADDIVWSVLQHEPDYRHLRREEVDFTAASDMVLARLLAFAAEVERETLTRAARLSCWYCAYGGHWTTRVVTTGWKWWHVPASGEENDRLECAAGAIHTAIRSLSEPPAETPGESTT